MEKDVWNRLQFCLSLPKKKVLKVPYDEREKNRSLIIFFYGAISEWCSWHDRSKMKQKKTFTSLYNFWHFKIDSFKDVIKKFLRFFEAKKALFKSDFLAWQKCHQLAKTVFRSVASNVGRKKNLDSFFSLHCAEWAEKMRNKNQSD